jgi:transposase
MRWHGRRVAVYAYAVPTDMRNGFDGLCALVTQGLHRNPLSGDVFVFVSRNRVRAKILQWDGTGLCVYAKRLEKGRFARVWSENADAPITLTVSELELFLDGSTWVGRVALSPPAITHVSLASDHFSLASDHE